jgi:hypothetical protein
MWHGRQNRSQGGDFEIQLQCGKRDRTHYTECGVGTQLLMVAWEKCEMDIYLFVNWSS